MDCEWSVDEVDGCTLRLLCKMKDACDRDECYDLDTLVDKAFSAPRHFTDNRLISGPSANYSNECSVKYGKICPSADPTYWSDYLPDTTPLLDNYLYPAYSAFSHTVYTYILLPLLNWVFTPTYDYVLTPFMDYALYPMFGFLRTIGHSAYDLLPDADMYTLEFLIHFLACVFTVAALFIVLFVYFCYVFTDRAKFGVVTRHPLKDQVTSASRASDDACQPGCTKDHVHRRSLVNTTVAKETSSRLRGGAFLSAGRGSHDHEAARRLSTSKVPKDPGNGGGVASRGGWIPRGFMAGVTGSSGAAGGAMFGGRRRRSSHDLHRKLTQIAQSFDRPRRISGSLDEEDDPRDLRGFLREEEGEMDVDHMARNTCSVQ